MKKTCMLIMGLLITGATAGAADKAPSPAPSPSGPQAAASAAPTDELGRLVQEGTEGTYKFTGSCPKMDHDLAKKITSAQVAAVITDGRKKIKASNPANDPKKAARSITAVLDAAVSLACQVDGPAHNKAALKLKAPDRWIQVLGAKNFLKKAEYAGAIDDYGAYLQMDGRHKEAMPIFEKVIKLDPQSDEVYLHLADSQWIFKQFNKAKENYRTYRHLHIMKYGHGSVPPYVEDRLGNP